MEEIINRENENSLVSLKSQCDDFGVEFDVIPAINPDDFKDPRQFEIYRGVSSVEAQLAATQAKIDEINAEIDRLTNHADGIDYTVAVACGVLTGTLDIFFVGALDLDWGSDTVNNFVIESAKKQKADQKIKAAIENAKKKGKVLSQEKINEIRKSVESEFIGTDADFETILKKAIIFFENNYKLPGDNVHQTAGRGISSNSHHLDDLAHHPTILGLFCSILMQFTKYGVYQNKNGVTKPYAVENDLVGTSVPEKIFAGTVNWFWHLVSDMAGSRKTPGAGMGIPGPIMSLAKEISMIPGINKTPLPKMLGNLFEQGKIDLRFELSIGHGLGKQAIPVLINEAAVRAFYFIRHAVEEFRSTHSFWEIDWKSTLPFKNRTIVRMMTIASGTFTAVDMADAAIRAAGKSGGTLSGFAAQMVLRVNFVGVGRFAIAVGSDVKMGIQRSRARDERMALYTEQIALTDAKVFYRQADMWIEAENTRTAIEQACNAAEKTGAYYISAMQEIGESMTNIAEYLPEVQKKNPALTDEMLDILEWG